MKLVRRPVRDSYAEHRDPGRLPDLTSCAERVRLASARVAHNNRDTVAIEAQPPHDRPLLLAESRPARVCGLDGAARRDGNATASGGDCVVDDPLLERQQSRRPR
ncbi:MAG TPA: hypothetical protein VJU80_12715, partial [Solirubrobacteraceae bacterium]|nr:hypothetical protein [Solirubrobacteraceae bacterium]